MHFIYLLVLCYALTIPAPVHTYAIIIGNLNDFRLLAKKLSLNVPEKFKNTGQQNEYKYVGEVYNEQTDKAVEDQEESQRNQRGDSIEEITKFITDIVKKPASVHGFKSERDVSPIEMKKTPTVLDVDNNKEKIKQKILQEIARSDDARKINAAIGKQASYAQEDQQHIISQLVFKDSSNKSSELAEANRQVQNPVRDPVPMKVLKEEIQIEATYEESQDKKVEPEAQKREAQSPEPMVEKQDKTYTKNDLPIKNKTAKKLRFVKQMVMADNQEQSSTQQLMVQQPNSNQLTSMVQQLTRMQQQINQINTTAQQMLKDKQVGQLTPQPVEDEQIKIEAKEAHSEVPNATEEEIVDDEKETNNIYDDYVFEEEIESTPATNTNTKELREVTATIKDEQSTKGNELAEDATEAVENDDEAAEESETPKEATDNVSNEDNNVTKLGGTLSGKIKKDDSKIPTKDFGTPIIEPRSVEKTVNFNEPLRMGDKKNTESLGLNIRPSGARKVMLL